MVDLQADTAWVIQDEVLDAWYVETGQVPPPVARHAGETISQLTTAIEMNTSSM